MRCCAIPSPTSILSLFFFPPSPNVVADKFGDKFDHHKDTSAQDFSVAIHCLEVKELSLMYSV